MQGLYPVLFIRFANNDTYTMFIKTRMIGVWHSENRVYMVPKSDEA